MSAAIGKLLARFLNRPTRRFQSSGPKATDGLGALLKPGDVLLVEGNTRLGAAIRYLTQSTWSHAALFVGEVPGVAGSGTEPNLFIEADLARGVCATPLSAYAGLRTRICRPTALSRGDVSRVVDFMVRSLGKRYDLKNIVDLARYFLPLVPVPPRWRRELVQLGSCTPAKAICSTLIAEAFQSIGYPILLQRAPGHAPGGVGETQAFRPRHPSLCVPRDFDISPYFTIVKPGLEGELDLRRLRWMQSAPEISAVHAGAEAALTIAAN
jgi:hypothetical protein